MAEKTAAQSLAESRDRLSLLDEKGWIAPTREKKPSELTADQLAHVERVRAALKATGLPVKERWVDPAYSMVTRSSHLMDFLSGGPKEYGEEHEGDVFGFWEVDHPTDPDKRLGVFYTEKGPVPGKHYAWNDYVSPDPEHPDVDPHRLSFQMYFKAGPGSDFPYIDPDYDSAGEFGTSFEPALAALPNFIKTRFLVGGPLEEKAMTTKKPAAQHIAESRKKLSELMGGLIDPGKGGPVGALGPDMAAKIDEIVQALKGLGLDPIVDFARDKEEGVGVFGISTSADAFARIVAYHPTADRTLCVIYTQAGMDRGSNVVGFDASQAGDSGPDKLGFQVLSGKGIDGRLIFDDTESGTTDSSSYRQVFPRMLEYVKTQFLPDSTYMPHMPLREHASGYALKAGKWGAVAGGTAGFFTPVPGATALGAIVGGFVAFFLGNAVGAVKDFFVTRTWRVHVKPFCDAVDALAKKHGLDRLVEKVERNVEWDHSVRIMLTSEKKSTNSFDGPRENYVLFTAHMKGDEGTDNWDYEVDFSMVHAGVDKGTSAVTTDQETGDLQTVIAWADAKIAAHKEIFGPEYEYRAMTWDEVSADAKAKAKAAQAPAQIAAESKFMRLVRKWAVKEDSYVEAEPGPKRFQIYTIDGKIYAVGEEDDEEKAIALALAISKTGAKVFVLDTKANPQRVVVFFKDGQKTDWAKRFD